jgi:hypothetical protein
MLDVGNLFVVSRLGNKVTEKSRGIHSTPIARHNRYR